MSLMSGKSFAIGEGGIMVTDNREIYERGLAFGHYERYDERITSPELRRYRNLPLGGYKYRMHQVSSAMGRVQLKYYDERMVEIRRAMNYFWDLLEGAPGLQPHRVNEGEGKTMAGWYSPHGLYDSTALGGLSVTRFAEAVRAEGSSCGAGTNRPLHIHPLLTECDVYGDDRPTRIAHSQRDLLAEQGTLPVSEKIGAMTYNIPWFKHYRPEVIEQHAGAFRKVAENAAQLLAGDPGNAPDVVSWPALVRP